MIKHQLKIELRVPFLGTRSYIQGPSIIEKIHDKIGVPQKYLFKVKKEITTNFITLMNEKDPRETHAAEYQCLRSDKNEMFYLIPNEPIKPETRKEFDESKITNFAKISNKDALLLNPSPFPLPTEIVSLNKHLLKTMFSHKNKGRWVFLQLELSQKSMATRPLRVEKDSEIKALKIVRSKVFIAEEYVGTLDFLWKNN